jgi:hypothetical protein
LGIDWITGILMSELILFTLNAVVVYLVADWLVRLIEQRRGAVMKQRQVVFFVIPDEFPANAKSAWSSTWLKILTSP